MLMKKIPRVQFWLTYQEKFHKTKKTHQWLNLPALGFQFYKQAGCRQLARVQLILKARCLCRGRKNIQNVFRKNVFS